MKNVKRLLAVITIAALALVISGAPGAGAAENTGNGLKLSPVRTDLVMQPGESKVVSITVTNVTGSTETFKAEINDFVARDETGAPSLLLDGGVNAQHGLKKYIIAPPPTTIEAGAKKEIKVTVTIPQSASAGGYYGAVRFVPSSTSGGSVSLSGSVGSLILVTVPGAVTENLQIASFDARKNDSPNFIFTSGKDLTATVRFRNSGDVQTQPFGKVTLKKGDKVLATYEVNNVDPRGNVLPDSIRKFHVPLKDVGSFGKYSLEGNFGYGSNGRLLTASTTFFVVPLIVILAAVLLVGLILFLIFGLPKMIRRHDQSVLRRAGRR